jgi:hypothetical protein
MNPPAPRDRRAVAPAAPAAATHWPLLAARACAWALLMSGWVGIGALALQMAPSTFTGFLVVALWLLALGAAATLPRPASMPPRLRAASLAAAATAAALAMWATPHGGGLPALGVALLGWATLTALASGVVRALRLQQAAMPRPPVASAALGAMAAAWAIGDPGDLMALSLRLALFAIAVAALLVMLQLRARPVAARPGCRAGLFDCSLPAWPGGAWREPMQWPTLLAGLAMLPMMAQLPLMASWCRGSGLSAQAMVLLHLGAMFLPVWLLNASLARWSLARLSLVCALLLVTGAGALAWAPSPWDWLGLAAAQGTAWGLAWGGLLWAPARRGSAGSSPLRAAVGYAVVTAAFGWLVESSGAGGVAAAHGALGAAAMAAWLFAALRRLRPSAA